VPWRVALYEDAVSDSRTTRQNEQAGVAGQRRREKRAAARRRLSGGVTLAANDIFGGARSGGSAASCGGGVPSYTSPRAWLVRRERRANNVARRAEASVARRGGSSDHGIRCNAAYS